MSTPNEPNKPYGEQDPEQPQDPFRKQDPAAPTPPPYGSSPEPGAPQYPVGPPAAPQYPAGPPAAPQYGTPQYGSPQYGSPQYGSPQYPQAPQYGAAGYGPNPGEKNQLAVWALVLGILGVVCCGIFTGIPALIMGRRAKSYAAQGRLTNGGLATAAVVLGWVSIAITVLQIIGVATGYGPSSN